ncbi:MAG: sugar kinase [Candidatus Aminicenantes bacterium]|nr:sugar kinase [Candidatus Aminicenantes bacterium]
MSLVIVGSLAFDTIETPKGRKERIVGGSCTYCALAASYFTSPGIVGVVGEDFPEEVIELLKKRKIDIQGLERKPGKTFHWEGRYGHDPNFRTTLKLEMNVFDNFKPELPAKYKETDMLFLANIDPDLQEDILSQVKKPKIVAMDTINFWIKNKRPQLVRVMEKVDVFFANDEEVKLLTEEINLIKAGKRVLNMGPSLVVIKKGEHGALVLGKNNIFGVLAYPCEDVVDPTGAGDSFAGGFLGYMDRARQGNQSDIRKAAVFGSVMASYTIEDFGIERLKSLSDSEIKDRFSAFKKLLSF